MARLQGAATNVLTITTASQDFGCQIDQTSDVAQNVKNSFTHAFYSYKLYTYIKYSYININLTKLET